MPNDNYFDNSQTTLRDGAIQFSPVGHWTQDSLFPTDEDLKELTPQGELVKETALQEAHRLINGDRNADYDHPLDNFAKTAQIWSVILGIPVSPEQVGLCMVGLKLAREVHKPKRDNLVDAAGYIGTVDMVITEKKRRGII